MTLYKTVMALILSLCLSISPVYADSILSPLTDSVNSGIINTKMATDNRLDGTNVDATVINGVAIFSGEVRSKTQMKILIGIANSVSGIKGVNVSKLRVVGP